jgi:hypothetical protein
MGVIILTAQGNRCHYPSTSRAYCRVLMRCAASSRGGRQIGQSTAASFEPIKVGGAGRLQQFELHRPTGLSLRNHRSGTNATTAHEIADPHLHGVASRQLAVESRD